MKHLSIGVLSLALVAFSLSSCGKKSDAPGGADSTKAAVEAQKPASAVSPMTANYPIKSGIIHGETDAMGMKGTTTKYFDDNGAKMREETATSMTMASMTVKSNQIRIIKDGWIYSYDADKKTGTKMKYAVPANMDFKNMGEKMMKDMGVKDAGTETILGKECKIFEYTNGDKGMSGKTWVFWNSVPMRMDMKLNNMAMKSHVTSIEENVSIPADKFEVPADVTIKEIGMNMPPAAGGK